MLIVPDEFKNSVKTDIARIDKALKLNTPKDDLIDLHRDIDGKYQSCVTNWYQGFYFVMNTQGSNPSINYRKFETCFNEVSANLSMMKSKLETYLFGMNAVSLPEPPTTTVNVNTNVNINITFEQVRSQIEDMTSLTDEQTQDILSKVNEIESVVNSTSSKKTKWEKIKPVLTWLADKSFDVAMTILPLLLKIQG